SPDSRVRLATLTISTPGWSRSFGMWYLRVFAPAPTIPTRRVSAFARTISPPRPDSFPCRRRGRDFLTLVIRAHVSQDGDIAALPGHQRQSPAGKTSVAELRQKAVTFPVTPLPKNDRTPWPRRPRHTCIH